MATEAVAGQNGLHILVEVKMFARMRRDGMPALATCDCRQQGSRDHHGGRRAEMRGPEREYYRGQVAGLRTVGDIGGSNP